MLFNKKIKLVTLLGASVFPTSFLLSCGSPANHEFKGFSNYVKGLEQQNSNAIYDAKILKWFDGDTPKVEYTDSFGNTKQASLRLEGVDTPESHVPNASTPTGDLTAFELKWAKKAGDWARQEIPVGTKIKFYKTDTDAYSRITAHIFYSKQGSNDNENQFNENYSVNLLKEGLSLPLGPSVSEIVKASYKTNVIDHYTFIPMYYAYSYAKKNKKGLFSLSNEELEKAYKKHGVPKTSFDSDFIKKYTDGWIDGEKIKKYEIYT